MKPMKSKKRHMDSVEYAQYWAQAEKEAQRKDPYPNLEDVFRSRLRISTINDHDVTSPHQNRADNSDKFLDELPKDLAAPNDMGLNAGGHDATLGLNGEGDSGKIRKGDLNQNKPTAAVPAFSKLAPLKSWLGAMEGNIEACGPTGEAENHVPSHWGTDSGRAGPEHVCEQEEHRCNPVASSSTAIQFIPPTRILDPIEAIEATVSAAIDNGSSTNGTGEPRIPQQGRQRSLALARRMQVAVTQGSAVLQDLRRISQELHEVRQGLEEVAQQYAVRNQKLLARERRLQRMKQELSNVGQKPRGIARDVSHQERHEKHVQQDRRKRAHASDSDSDDEDWDAARKSYLRKATSTSIFSPWVIGGKCRGGTAQLATQSKPQGAPESQPNADVDGELAAALESQPSKKRKTTSIGEKRPQGKQQLRNRQHWAPY
jgi:hypothetical protein